MRPRLAFGSMLVLGVLLLVSGVIGFNWGDPQEPDSSLEQYNNLVREHADVYPNFAREDRSLTMTGREEITRSQRDYDMTLWQELIEKAEGDELLANALFYFALNYYANAGDFGELKSAEEAIVALSASIALGPGDAYKGYTEIEWQRKRFLELAINLKRHIEEEKEKQEQEQQGKDQEKQTAAPVPVPDDGGGQGGGGPADLPILEPGVRP